MEEQSVDDHFCDPWFKYVDSCRVRQSILHFQQIHFFTSLYFTIIGPRGEISVSDFNL